MKLTRKIFITLAFLSAGAVAGACGPKPVPVADPANQQVDLRKGLEGYWEMETDPNYSRILLHISEEGTLEELLYPKGPSSGFGPFLAGRGRLDEGGTFEDTHASEIYPRFALEGVEGRARDQHPRDVSPLIQFRIIDHDHIAATSDLREIKRVIKESMYYPNTYPDSEESAPDQVEARFFRVSGADFESGRKSWETQSEFQETQLQQPGAPLQQTEDFHFSEAHVTRERVIQPPRRRGRHRRRPLRQTPEVPPASQTEEIPSDGVHPAPQIRLTIDSYGTNFSVSYLFLRDAAGNLTSHLSCYPLSPANDTTGSRILFCNTLSGSSCDLFGVEGAVTSLTAGPTLTLGADRSTLSLQLNCQVEGEMRTYQFQYRS